MSEDRQRRIAVRHDAFYFHCRVEEWSDGTFIAYPDKFTDRGVTYTPGLECEGQGRNAEDAKNSLRVKILDLLGEAEGE